jgi:ABC-type uncharacterized transport system involved in gliding motility auxiliary subunit
MSGRRFALFAALAFGIMFIAANLVADVWFKSWRLDLTENHLYSLSDGTREVLDGLTEPVELTFYYSRDAAAQAPAIQAHGSRVREMLQSFAARSHGRVRFVEINVKPFSEEEDQAVEDGVEPIRLSENADPLYFGVSGANAIDDRRVVPFLDPQRESFLEYEVTRLIYELENPDPTRVALITALPMDPATAHTAALTGQTQSAFSQEMGRLMEVTKLTPDFAAIPEHTDVLVVIHPFPLSPAQSYAVDQWILAHGRAFVALDPASMSAAGGANPLDPLSATPTASNLEPLLGAWGVNMSSDVVLDLQGALPVNAQNESGQTVPAPQPLFFHIPPESMDREDLMTAWLQRGVNFGLAGVLRASEREGLTATPLARTTENTMRMPAERAMMRPSPFELMREPPPTQARRETVALHLSGTLRSAFPGGPPPGAPQAGQRLTQSATPSQVVIVADTDFLADEMYIGHEGVPAVDNAAFALNAIEVLSGSDALVSLRSRAPALRRMTRLDDMERDAQRRIQVEQEHLQGELQETEARLADLQTHGQGSGYFSGDLGAELNDEERGEIEQFRAKVTETRSELRGLERNLRGDINRLEAVMVFINVWLAPILVALAGVFVFWRRGRRTQARAGQ